MEKNADLLTYKERNLIEIEANVIKAKYTIKSELLYNNDFLGLTVNNSVAKNVVYLNVEDIKSKSSICGNEVLIQSEFNISCMLEFYDYYTKFKSYDLITDKKKVQFHILGNKFRPQIILNNELKCIFKIYNFIPKHEINLQGTGLSIFIYADLNVYILEEKICKVRPLPIKQEDLAECDINSSIFESLTNEKKPITQIDERDWNCLCMEFAKKEEGIKLLNAKIDSLNTINRNLIMQLENNIAGN